MNSNLEFPLLVELESGQLGTSRTTVLSILAVMHCGIVGYMFASKSTTMSCTRVCRIGRLGITMGIIGVFMIFLFYQEIYIFSARFWFLIWLVVVAVWVRSIVHLAKVKIPREKRTLAEQQAFERYLPQKKR